VKDTNTFSKFPSEIWILNKNGTPTLWCDESLDSTDVRYVKATPLTDAAADLLSALQECDEAMEYMSEYDIPITLPDKVKSAIAKAIGNS
jgi:hypothetical protein